MKCSIVSQLISLITGAFVEEPEEYACNEDCRGVAAKVVRPRPINVAIIILVLITVHFSDSLVNNGNP
jgi:hypothetical protein